MNRFPVWSLLMLFWAGLGALAACSNSPSATDTPANAGTESKRKDTPATAAAADSAKNPELYLGVDSAGPWVLLPFDDALKFEPVLHEPALEEGIVLLDGVPVGLDTSFMTVEDMLRKIKLVGQRLSTASMPQSLLCSPPVRDAIAELHLPRLLVNLRGPGDQSKALSECLRKLAIPELHLVLHRPDAVEFEAVAAVAEITELRLLNPQAPRQALAALAYMPGLQSLQITGVSLDSNTWAALLGMRKLQVLDIAGCSVDQDNPPGPPPKTVPPLKALFAAQIKGDPAFLIPLIQQLDPVKFQALELPGTPAAPGQGQFLEQFTNLRSLRVGWLGKGALNLDFSKLTNLVELDLYGGKIKPEQIPGIATLMGLKILCLTDGRLGDTEARQLLQIRGLESLHLGDTAITDALMADVANMPQLKALYLPSTSITDVGVKALAQNQQIRRLVLSKTRITDNSGVFLGRMKGLVSLVLEDLPFSNLGAAYLDDLPQLRFLHLDRTQVADKAIPRFVKLAKLEVLDLQGTKVTGNTLGSLAVLEQLERLDLTNTPISGENLRAQEPLPKLKTLTLTGTKANADVIIWATTLPSLVRLELGGKELDLTALQYLMRSKSLAHLTLVACNPQSDALEGLSRVQFLQSLTLPYNPEVQAEAFAPLQQNKHLGSVVLTGSAKKSKEDMERIREYLPHVQVYYTGSR